MKAITLARQSLFIIIIVVTVRRFLAPKVFIAVFVVLVVVTCEIHVGFYENLRNMEIFDV